MAEQKQRREAQADGLSVQPGADAEAETAAPEPAAEAPHDPAHGGALNLWQFAQRATPEACRIAVTWGVWGLRRYTRATYLRAEREARRRRPPTVPEQDDAGEREALTGGAPGTTLPYSYVLAELRNRLAQRAVLQHRLVTMEIPARVRRALARGGVRVDAYVAGKFARVPARDLGALQPDLLTSRLIGDGQVYERVRVTLLAPAAAARAYAPAALLRDICEHIKAEMDRSGAKPKEMQVKSAVASHVTQDQWQLVWKKVPVELKRRRGEKDPPTARA